MITSKLALIIASLALALALAVNASAMAPTARPDAISWHGSDNHGSHGPHA